MRVENGKIVYQGDWYDGLGFQKLGLDRGDDLAHGLDFGTRDKHRDVGEEVGAIAQQRVAIKLAL